MKAVVSLLALLCLSTLAIGQSGPPTDDLQKRHRMVVRGERTTAFLELYRDLEEDSAVRTAVHEATEFLLPSNRASGRRPRLDELAVLTRVARGQDLEAIRADPLMHFVDSVDLQVVPGAFREVLPENRRAEKLRVFAYSLYSTAFSGQLSMKLIWISPSGEEHVARRESFPSSMSKQPGITFFVDAPVSVPGAWSIVLEVEYEGRTARGIAVPVPCIEPEAKLSAPMRERGLRSLTLPADVLHKAPESGPFEGIRGVVYEGDEQGEKGKVFVFLSPLGEPASMPFTGRGGELLMRDGPAGSRILSLEVTKREADPFAEGLQALRAEDPERPIVVVARGDAVTTLALISSKHALAMDRAVLIAERVPIPPGLSEIELEIWSNEKPLVPPGSQVRWSASPFPSALFFDADLFGSTQSKFLQPIGG